MGEKTNIPWTDHSFSIVHGCQKIDPGCANCYSEAFSRRVGRDIWGPDKPRLTMSEKYWKQPLIWNRKAANGVPGVLGPGNPHLVFCTHMGDLFENHPTVTEQREKLWPLIRATPNLHWQLLTKRADRIRQCLPADWGEDGYPNVWLGVSVSEAKGLWRIECLNEIIAQLCFVSYEPALGPIEANLVGIDWLIYGGESGPRYRPDSAEWAENAWLQCKASGTKFFYKQSAGPRPGLRIHSLPQEFPV